MIYILEDISFYKRLRRPVIMAKIEISGKTSREKLDYLFSNPEIMREEYLGEVLDSCRWGAPTTCMWDRGEEDMVNLVDLWMGQNRGNLHRLFVSKYEPMELPRKDSHCKIHPDAPRNRDNKGILRCMHVDIRYLRPSFIKGDELCGFYEHVPDVGDEDFGKWKAEESSAKITEPCYDVLEDEEDVLSLSEVFHRLNLLPRMGFDPFISFDKNYVVQMNGESLAGYVRTWFEQGDGVSLRD